MNTAIEELSTLALLREIIKRNRHSEAPTKTVRHVPHRETLIAVGNDHTASITMDEETLVLVLRPDIPPKKQEPSTTTGHLDTLALDISKAESWAKPEHLIPGIGAGEGEGWRHTCYRLAQFAKARLRHQRVVSCVYCGKQYEDGTPTSQDHRLTQHIKVCEKHPLRNAEKRNQDLTQSLTDARLERDQAVLEAKALITNISRKVDVPFYVKAHQWLDKYFPKQ